MAVKIKSGKAMVYIVVDHCGLTTQTLKYAVLKLKKSFQKIPNVVAQPTTNARRYVATIKSATNSRITWPCLAVAEIRTTARNRYVATEMFIRSLFAASRDGGDAITYMKLNALTEEFGLLPQRKHVER